MGRLPYAIIAQAGSCNSVRLARPCLLQKNVKGTVGKCGRESCATVPFTKKRQRHGRNRGLWGAGDRAFYKKASKARSKLRGKGRSRPCLSQKNGKGTVEKRGRGSSATVPFAKKRQRHGRKVHPDGLRDRAFCKKASKAQSKSGGEGRVRPCLLQKSVKGTVGKVPARWPASFYKEAAFGGSL